MDAQDGQDENETKAKGSGVGHCFPFSQVENIVAERQFNCGILIGAGQSGEYLVE